MVFNLVVPLLFALDHQLIVSFAAPLASLILVSRETLLQTRLLSVALSAVILSLALVSTVGGGGNLRQFLACLQASFTVLLPLLLPLRRQAVVTTCLRKVKHRITDAAGSACNRRRRHAGCAQFLHTDLQVVHRDFKPGNILLSTSGQAKLADLGIATLPGEVQVDPRGDALSLDADSGCSTMVFNLIGDEEDIGTERFKCQVESG